MKQTIVIVLLAVSLMQSLFAGAKKDNLFLNGGFENGVKQWNWQQYLDKVEPGKLNRKTSYKGLASYCMSLPGYKGKRRLTTNAEIKPNQDYELSLALRGKNLPNNCVNISILEWGHKKGSEKLVPLGWIALPARPGIKKLISTGGTFDWKVFKLHIPKQGIRPTTTRFTLYIVNSGIGTGELGIDEVTLIPAKEKDFARFLTAKKSNDIKANFFRLFTAQKGNLFQGEKAEILFTQNKPLTKLHSVDIVVTDYFNKTVKKTSFTPKQLKPVNKIVLANINGWFQLTLTAKDFSGKILETQLTSFIVLDKMKQDYYEKDNKSMFGAWGYFDKFDAKALGIKWRRNWYYWQFIQPGENKPFTFPDMPPAEPKFSYLMGFGHHSMSNWIWGVSPEAKKYGLVKDLNKLLEYIGKVVEAKKGTVSAWEIWNEPYFRTRLWPDDYASYIKVHKAVYERIKKIDPNTPVIGPSINPMVHMHDMKALFKMGLLKYCDGVSIHPYFQNSSPESSEFRTMLKTLKKLMRENGGEKPIWNTEYGWRGDKNSPIGGPKNQARYIVRSHLIQLAENVQTVIYWTVWSLPDVNNPTARWRCAFGFFDAFTATPRPSAAAYGVMTRMMYKTKFIKDLSGFNESTSAFLFEKKNKNILVLWDCQRARTILLFARNSITVTDMMGNKRTIKPKSGLVSLPIGLDPVYIHGLTHDDIDINHKLLIAKNSSNTTTGKGTIINLDKNIIPDGTMKLFLSYADVKQIRTEIVLVKIAGKQAKVEFSPKFSISKAPGIVRVFVKTAKGQPLGFTLCNMIPRLSVNGYQLELKNGIRILKLHYKVLENNGGVGGVVVLKADDQKESISVRFNANNESVEIPLPDSLVNGKRYDLQVFYSNNGDTAEACSYAFTYVPAIRTSPKEITIDGKIDDWENAEFIDFKTFPWYLTRSVSKEKFADVYDMQCSYALKWNKNKLYLAVKVENDDFYQNTPAHNIKNVWRLDSIQLGLDPFLQNRAALRPTGETQNVDDNWPFYRYTIAKFKDGAHARSDFSPYSNIISKGMVDPKGLELAIVVNAKSKSIIYEMAFDKTLLKPATLKVGTEFGFSVVVNDADPKRKERLAMEWSCGLANGSVHSKFGSFFLAE